MKTSAQTLKSFLVLLAGTCIFLLSSSFKPEDGPIVEIKCPTHVEPGQVFLIEFTIHKGNIAGSGRLQQFLPDGFTADANDSHSGEFIFDEQVAKFIWVDMPAESDFTVSYFVKVDEKLGGKQVINGLFSCVREDKAAKQFFAPVEIMVGSKTETTATVESNPSVERHLYSVKPENGEYRVELIIHRNQNESSAKFVDQIPEGFTASVIDAHSGAFNFENQEASFSWTNLPSDSVFTISYIVRAIRSAGAPVIQGMLLYGDSAGEETSVNNLNEAIPPSNDLPEKNADLIVDEMISGENEKPSNVIKQPVNPPVTKTPVFDNGTYFKVQICATNKSSTKQSEWFRNKYSITDDVDLTMHEGWKKYLVGNFDNYQAAKSYRKSTQTHIPDAFVVAYVDGQRTTLQHAIRKNQLNQ